MDSFNKKITAAYKLIHGMAMFRKTLCLLIFIVTMVDIVFSQEVGAECLRHTLLYASEVGHGTDWALRMLDSSTKIPDGLLYGNKNQLGNFDECLSVQVNDENFKGKYCQTSLVVSYLKELYVEKYNRSDIDMSYYKYKFNISRKNAMHLTLKAAICIPSSCSSKDTKYLIEKYLPELMESMLGISLNITASVGDSNCYVYESENFLSMDLWFPVILLLTMLVLVVLATVLDMLSTKEWWSVLHVFSARATARQLFSTRADPGTLGCLHGIRVGSLMWILFGHRYSTELTGPISNRVDMPQKTVTNSGYLAVDSFLFVSGLLVCYNLFKDMEKCKKFNPLAFYLYRYLRLAVPMLMVIFFYMTLLPFFGTGPLWNVYTKPMTDNCVKNWWVNALFVHNFVNTPTMCLPHSWYLAADMQLLWFCPAVLLPLYHRPRIGRLLLMLLIIAACFVPFTITYLRNYPWSILLKEPSSDNSYYVLIYMSSFSRATPYLVGIFTGYILTKLKNVLINIPKWLVFVGWTVSSAVCLSIIYTLIIAFQPHYVYNNIDAAFYAGFYSLGWSLGLSWTVLACTKGYGGPVDKILSWKFWQPVGRLSYGAYLMQYIVLNVELGNTRNSKYVSNFNAVHSFFGDLPVTFGLAIILYFIIEAPLISILHNTLKRRSNTVSTMNEKKSVEEIQVKAKEVPIKHSENWAQLFVQKLNV